MDWIELRIDNEYRNMRWRIDIIRSIDPECAIVAHGAAKSLTDAASNARIHDGPGGRNVSVSELL